jgi:Flp pilus assembly protein TadD
VLALDPARAEVWNNLAYALIQLGKRESALAAIARARLLDPANSNYLNSQNELDNWP